MICYKYDPTKRHVLVWYCQSGVAPGNLSGSDFDIHVDMCVYDFLECSHVFIVFSQSSRCNPNIEKVVHFLNSQKLSNNDLGLSHYFQTTNKIFEKRNPHLSIPS